MYITKSMEKLMNANDVWDQREASIISCSVRE